MLVYGGEDWLDAGIGVSFRNTVYKACVLYITFQ